MRWHYRSLCEDYVFPDNISYLANYEQFFVVYFTPVAAVCIAIAVQAIKWIQSCI